MFRKRNNHNLTVPEIAAFRTMEQFGWQIWFIRDAHTEERMVVLRHPDTNHIGTIKDDLWDLDSDIKLRQLPFNRGADTRAG